jgi:hypothetical protein
VGCKRIHKREAEIETEAMKLLRGAAGCMRKEPNKKHCNWDRSKCWNYKAQTTI